MDYKEVKRLSHYALCKYLEEKGLSTGMIKQEEVLNLFMTNPLIKRRCFERTGVRVEDELASICLELWEFYIPAAYKATPKNQRTKKQKRKSNKRKFVKSDNFYKSYEWRKLRYQALKKYGPKCMCCGATPETGATMNVDHIRPRKKFPELALDINNLQILCGACNHGKCNWDATDWRGDRAEIGIVVDAMKHI